ncbi:TetR/AcrR family transcriptional regulator [Salinispora pacifica]|uniref:TetR/AcrR family transcriptional regulator n=1 Tax=Salinispora pacifica TaxID=351187 RepID=UPI000370BDC6|nr:TetR/AcrR family transcriptional regulator [Salinispora pacifica]
MTTKKASSAGLPSERRTHLVRLAGELFAEKGFRATTVREIADAAGILSGSLYHHFDSKESIGDELLSGFLNEVLTGYREAVADTDDPRRTIEQFVRSSAATLARHRAALTMLQNDWNHFRAVPRFDYLRDATREIEHLWVDQLERGKQSGLFRSDLDAKLTYRLLRDVLWIPTRWGQNGSNGWTADQIADAVLRLIFDGILAPESRSAGGSPAGRSPRAKPTRS